jgi:regulator of sigma E protease
VTYVVAVVILLGVLIFFHELGHFVAARACGVRVLKFCLGFGSPIGFGRYRLAWKRGHTEYAIAWFPLGGFVKMLGENPDEAEDDEMRASPEETLGAKPTWQKLVIFLAGPAMNLILPIFFFLTLMAIGEDRPLPVIGQVEAGSPAERAGLRAGDRILALDAKPIAWWDELDERVRDHAGATLAIAVERDGARIERSLEIASRSEVDPFQQVSEVGFAGLAHRRVRAVVGIPAVNSPAALAGLRSGDRVTAVAGREVEDWEGFAAAYAAAAPGKVSVEIERVGARPTDADEPPELETHTLSLPVLGDVAALGAIPANVLVSGVAPGSAAEQAGLLAGDLILEVDGAPVGSFASFAERVRASRGEPLALRVARRGEVLGISVTPRMEEGETGIGSIKQPRYQVGVQSHQNTLQGAIGVDRETNPLVALPRALSRTGEEIAAIVVGISHFFTGAVSPKQLAGPIGIAEIAGTALQIGWQAYLHVMIAISINLGVLNLLPIPVLDGGQVVMACFEALRRSPMSLRARGLFQSVGVTLLLFLMGLAFWNDLSRHWANLIGLLRQGVGL